MIMFPHIQAMAQPHAAVARYTWHNVKVGAGGFAPGIVFSPARRGLAYLRTDMGGAYRWDGARQRWIALQDATGVSSYMGNESLAADPIDPRKVYLAAGMYHGEPAAILRSHDAGSHWQASRLPLSMGGNEDGRGLGERLAIAPFNRQMLLFGSRRDGLWQSSDGAVTWHRVAAFPYQAPPMARGAASNGGIAFVVFDQRPGQTRVYAGVADHGAAGLWQSDDGGAHWSPVPGAPVGMLPVKAAFDAAGRLFVVFADAIGPNGITTGAVWTMAPDGAPDRPWRDITPPRPAADGGFMGLAIDPTHPGTVAVATIDRWRAGDTIWLSRDNGASWRDLAPLSRRDISAAPWLGFGRGKADMGHWMTGLAFDPFQPGALAYSTGATIYRTVGTTGDRQLVWRPWIAGIEQTAILALVSPSRGAPLLSGFGDLGGFVHWQLDRSPPTMFLNPLHANTHSLDFAGQRPQDLVRAGDARNAGGWTAGLAWSGDGGGTWQPVPSPDPQHDTMVAVTADGRRILAMGPTAWYSDNLGGTWQAVTGLGAAASARPRDIVTDKHNAALAWVFDAASGEVLRSTNGGTDFAPVWSREQCRAHPGAAGPDQHAVLLLQASVLHAGELVLLCNGTLYHSGDAGEHFVALERDDKTWEPPFDFAQDRISAKNHAKTTTLEHDDVSEKRHHALAGPPSITLFGLGRGHGGHTAIYAASGRGPGLTLWQSLDGGQHWALIDNRGHRWGNRLRVIAGDPRRIGRVYIGTDGRGIFYGDPL